MFELPNLPYEYNALEPYISEEIMRLHHTKHHATYIAKLKEALEGHKDVADKDPESLIKTLDQVPEDIRTKVRNHGGGHVNHTFFWMNMMPPKGAKPAGKVAKALDETFGNFETFKQQFATQAAGIFGSGWEWLVVNNGKLELMSTQNQDSPLTGGKTPILGLDIWEHAYYLQYYNKRPEYIEAWWNVVNWEDVEKRFEEASNA